MQELVKTEEGALVDIWTGEVLSNPEEYRDILFGKLQPPDITRPLSKADLLCLGNCIDAAVEKIGDVAARAQAYRDMAEKKASPLEKRVNRYLELLKPWATKLAELTLPRVQSGPNAGNYSKKTLDCDRASLAFRKSGGTYFCNEREVIEWLETHAPELAQECIKVEVITKKTVKIKRFLELYSPKLWPKCPEITEIPVDEFATMKLELPK
jgi:hypothetical protein